MRSTFLAPSLLFFMLGPALVGAQTPDEKVTLDSLPKMLTGLGLEPKKSGEAAYVIVIERNKFTFRISVSISGNEKKLWMSSYLVEIPDLSKVASTTLAEALQSNADTGPAHYYLVKSGDKFWLKIGFALDNRNVTPAYFRSELDWFLDKMADSASVWEKEKWGPKP